MDEAVTILRRRPRLVHKVVSCVVNHAAQTRLIEIYLGIHHMISMVLREVDLYGSS
jgi:hypothetical protein